MRIDKWLWAARFYKTRALAVKACELGRVQWQGSNVKPSREVRVNDQLTIRNGSGIFTITVLGLSDMRGPAPVAQQLYVESEESKQLRAEAVNERRSMPQIEVDRAGRPSKRDRREMARLRDRA